jgi:hypothetical protein
MIFEYFPQPITGQILGEASFVGIILILFVYIVSFILHYIYPAPSLPDICKMWNSGHIMEISLFFSGFLFHLVFELFGWNKMYAINKIKSL